MTCGVKYLESCQLVVWRLQSEIFTEGFSVWTDSVKAEVWFDLREWPCPENSPSTFPIF